MTDVTTHVVRVGRGTRGRRPLGVWGVTKDFRDRILKATGVVAGVRKARFAECGAVIVDYHHSADREEIRLAIIEKLRTDIPELHIESGTKFSDSARFANRPVRKQSTRQPSPHSRY